MTDMTKYKNVSLSKETYSVLDKLSKVLMPDFQVENYQLLRLLNTLQTRK